MWAFPSGSSTIGHVFRVEANRIRLECESQVLKKWFWWYVQMRKEVFRFNGNYQLNRLNSVLVEVLTSEVGVANIGRLRRQLN